MRRQSRRLSALAATVVFALVAEAGAPPTPAPAQPPAAQVEETGGNPEAPETYAALFATWPEPVRAATVALFRKNDERWAWTYTQRTADESLTVRWDPTRPEEERSWLLEKNGVTATEEEARRYGIESAKERTARRPDDNARRRERNRRWLATLSFEALPASADDPPGSQGWRVVSRAGDATYDGLPVGDRIRNRILSGLDLRVWTRVEPPYEFLRITGHNPAPLNPYFSVNLKTVRFDLQLAPPPHLPEAPCLPVRLSGALVGSYLLLGSIDETFESEFRDHSPVGSTSVGQR